LVRSQTFVVPQHTGPSGPHDSCSAAQAQTWLKHDPTVQSEVERHEPPSAWHGPFAHFTTQWLVGSHAVPPQQMGLPPPQLSCSAAHAHVPLMHDPPGQQPFMSSHAPPSPRHTGLIGDFSISAGGVEQPTHSSATRSRL
jgi:hypothetical protein